ncbi:MAG TPA: hypothetical protein DCY18_11805 [Thauera sp.]|nr:hypothetical protein [Thauera sp.]HRJ24994.1 hypothetical protein [Thauera sp.]
MDDRKALETATAGINAWALFADGDVIGRIVTKRGRTGRVTAWVQVWGAPGVFAKGWADGYGYDKTTAAIEDAAERWLKATKPAEEDCSLGTCMMRALVFPPAVDWDACLRGLNIRAQYIV